MNKRLLFAAFISCIFSSVIYSQTDLQKGNEISVMAGMTTTKIKNSNLSSDTHLSIDNKNGVDFIFEYARYIKNRVGFGIGLGCSTYANSYSQKGLYKLSNQVGPDSVTYEKWINSNMEYTNKLMYFDLPISLHLILGSSPTYYGFVDAGIVNQFLINGTYTEEGNIETSGIFSISDPYWSLETQNNPYYDLKNKSVSKKDTEKYKFYNLSAHLAIGMAAALTDNLFLKVAPFVNIGQSDIMGKDGKGKDYANVLGEISPYKKTTLFSAGVNVGFAFNLN
jgi:hypothetical protein